MEATSLLGLGTAAAGAGSGLKPVRGTLEAFSSALDGSVGLLVDAVAVGAFTPDSGAGCSGGGGADVSVGAAPEGELSPAGSATTWSALIMRSSPVSFTRTVNVFVCGSDATTSSRPLRSSAALAQVIWSSPPPSPSLPQAAMPSRATLDRPSIASARRYVT